MQRYSVELIQSKLDDLFEGESPVKLIDSYTYKNRSSILGYLCPDYSGDTVHEVEAEHLLRRINRRNKTLDYCQEMIDNSETPLDKAIEMVTAKYGSFPYEVLGSYVDSKTPIEMKCLRCDNILTTIRVNHLREYALNDVIEPPCKHCMISRHSNNKVGTYQSYMAEIEELLPEGERYEVILENSTDPLKFNRSRKHLHRCEVCDYEWMVTPANILNEMRNKNRRCCPNCSDMVRMDIDFNQWLTEHRPDLNTDDDITVMKNKYSFTCNVCDGNFEGVPYNIYRGSGCHICNKYSGGPSSYEDILYDYLINDLGIPNVQRNVRGLLNDNKELDLYLPEYNLAIEVNGLYYHSHRYKDKDYHLNKTIDAKSVGIRLIHIFTDEINHKLDIVKDKLRHLLQLTPNRIYARKCRVETISKKEKSEFLKVNHIQGPDHSSLELGLYHDDDLVAVMTYCKSRRVNGYVDSDSTGYELSRYATLLGHSVVGGFSKLLKHATNILRDELGSSYIYTYADRNLSDGNLYLQNGFVHIRNTKPSYFYINKNTEKRTHRYTFRKSELKKLFPEHYDKSLTEFEIMDNVGLYLRVYNTGNMYFEYIF